ncbi:DUF7507 domain-containing protein [Lysobacter antibioticus]|uniref:DUF7507 domain-containing protein n=1 Tax=Lysobacter antibioticus TaxID=84531 RepID=UPI000716415C|nr:isopeptide-forming domain-containing fimbrial protein [Lysobacter antibioticus]
MIAKFQALATAFSRRMIMPVAFAASLLLTADPVHAQQAVNKATVTAPTGVTDPDCNDISPDPCNSATDSDSILASLTLIKTVTNDNGGTAVATAWTLQAAGPTPISGVTGATAVTSAPVSPGSYTLSETGGPSGYTAGTYSCVVNGGAPVVSNSLTLAFGDTATCTINNDDQAATLTLVKTVTNDNGGTATISDFPLTATGPTTITGVSGTATVTNAPVSAGVYTLTEAAVAGYTAGAWSCTAGTLSGNSLTLANGVSATCTIVNDDQAATLTLVKTVTNDNGGTATISDFPLTATGPTTITGVSGTATVTNAPVSAGIYTLTEAVVAGYTAGAWSCTAGTLSGNSLTLANGVSATCTIVNDDQAATLTLVKTVTNDSGGTATISDFPLTATGPTTITGISGDAAVTSAPVSAGVYTLTEASVAGYTAGAWSCTAGTLSGNSLTLANGVSATCTIVNDDIPPTQTIAKTMTNADNDGSGTVSLGDVLTYTVTVTNTSTTTNLNNVVVSDSKITPTGGTTPCASVVPGGTCTLIGTYTVTAADVTAGSISNTATSTSAICPAGSTDPACTTTVNTPVTPLSQTLAKAMTGNADEDGSGTVSLGDTLTYTVTVTNTSASGNLTNVVVSDSKITPSTITCATVAPTATCVLTGTYVVTAADVTAGSISNTATSTSPACPAGSTDPACTTTVNTPVTPLSQTLAKAMTGNADEDGSGTVSLGDTLTYTVTVTNTSASGNLTNVVVSDSKITPSTITCATVAPTATCVLTGTYVVTAADVTAGSISNTATSTSPACPAGSTDPACTTTVNTPVTPLSQTLAKAMTGNADEDGSGTVSLGDTLTYTVTVTNTSASGNLTNVVVSDSKITPSTITCATVAPTATCVLTGTYVVTAADVTAGSISNTATSTSPACPAGSTDPACTTTVNTPVTPLSQTLAKAMTGNADEDGSGTVSLGDTLTYTVTVTNTSASGNLTNVVVSDSKITPSTITCATVAPTATCVLTGTYVVTAADVTAGSISNTATSTSPACPAGSTDPACTTTVNTPVTPLSQTLAKAMTGNADEDGSGTVSLGDTLTYTVTVTNTSASGNLTNVVVSDSKITPSTITCATVAPTATCVLTGTYVVTAADVTAGSISNTATSTSPACPAGSTDPACTTTVNTPVTPLSQTLAKAMTGNADEDGSGTVSLGDTLTYTVTVTNTSASGNLTNVVVSDSKITPSTITCATVAPTATCVLTGTYVVTAADVTAGSISNTATSTSPACPAGSTDPACTTTVNTPVTPLSQTLAKAMTGNADEDGSGTVSLGDTLTYTVTVTNTSASGNLTNVVVSDSKITPSTITCATVAPTATCVLTGTYVVTAADVTAGSISNTATSTSPACPAGSTDPACTTTVNTPVTPLSQTLAKAMTGNADEDGSGTVSLGDTLTYTVTVTNTSASGNLTNVVVSDSKITPSTITCATVAPTATCVLTGTYVVTAADVTAGSISNTATSTSPACPAGSTDPACTTTVNTPVTPLSQTLAKAMTGNADEDGSGTVSLGDTLTYTVTVTNTSASGNLTNVVVSDSKITPSTITCATVAPTATCVLTGTYVVTAADVTAGSISNTATSTSPACPAGSTDPACTTTVNTPVTPLSQTLAKAMTGNADEDGSGTVSLGDTLTYTVTVTNTSASGNLTNVVVSDSKITPSTITCATVAPTATCVLTGTYVVTAADVTAGSISNTATSTSPACPAGSTDPACTTTVNTPVTPLSQTLAKAMTGNADEDGSGTVSLGDTLTYTVTVTNTSASGNLTNVVVSDSKITPSTITCATVAPTATCVLTGTYVVTAADVTAGSISNTATSTSPACPAGSTDPACTTTVNTPVTPLSQTLAKAMTGNADEDGSGTVSLGDTLTYTVTVTNTSASGNLTNVVVSDSKITPSTITCATVAPTATCVLTGTYVVTAADVTAGSISNTATSTSPACPAGSTDPACTTTVNTPVTPLSQTLAKAMTGNADEDGSGTVSLGDTLTYTVTVTNTSASGNLTNVVVSDSKITPSTITCATVAPTATCVLTGTYVVTAADVTAGSISNTATSTSPACPAGSTDPACTTTVNTPVTPLSQTLAKAMTGNADEDGSGTVSLGDTLTYTVTVTNTSASGNLTNVVVSDSKITPSTITCATVAPTATCVLTGTYVVTAADVTAGSISNTATSTSPACPAGSTDPACTTTVNTPVTPLSQTLAKAMTGNADEDGSGTVSLGDTLTYTVTVTNTSASGNLTNVVVSDSKITPSTITCATVAPTATCVLTGTYVVTAADVTAGSISNTATSTSPACPAGSTDPACTTTVNTPVTPLSQTLAKAMTGNADEDGSGTVSLGDTLTYTVTVTNTSASGNLTNVVVSDSKITPSTITCATVAPTATCVLTGTYVVTAADVTAGSISNTATSTSPACPAGSTDPACTTTVNTPVTPLSQTLAKAMTGNADEDGSGTVSLGDTLTYTVTVTNTSASGNLTNVVVSDSKITPSTITCATVAPTATCVLTGTYVVTAADVTAGSISNTATSTSAICPAGSTDPACTTTVNTPVTPLSQTLAKAMTGNADEDGSGTVSLGDTLTYTVTVTNTSASGNLTNVVVSDSKITPSTITCATVAPTATCVLTGTYVVTAADVTAGSISNTATSTSPACPAGSTDPACTTTVNTPVTPLSQTLAKAMTGNADEDGSGTVSLGDTLTYTVTVTNTSASGNLTNVVVSDSKITPSTITCATVAPTATCVLTGTYVVTAADVTAGSISNTATSTSPACPAGSTDPACTTTVNTPVTALSQTIAKTMTNADNDGSGTVTVGDVLTYTVTVTNTSASGNLTNVVVNDSKITPSSTTCASVAPGATCALVGTYTVTAADVSASSISNTATSTSTVCPAGSTDPACTTTINTPVVPSTVSYTKSASTAGPVVVGDVITYTLTTTVANAQTIGVLTLTDTLGAGLDFVAVTGQSPASAYSCNAANPLVCTLPAGTVPGVYTVTYTARVNAQATGNVTNAVVGTGTDNPTCTGTCTTDTPVTASAVSYEKTASTAGPVVVGDVITYTLTATVTNAQTTGVTTLTDTMGSGLDFVAVTSAGAFTCNAANPLVCSLPAGTVPGSYAVTYTARVNGQAGGSVNNAVVGTGTDAPSCSNAGCSVTTEVAPPVVSYAKSASTAGPVAQGDTITYTLTTTVANAPTRNALTLTDTLGTGLDFTAVTGAAGYSCNAANPLVCTLPAGTVPGTYTVTYTAKVNAQASETVNNTVVGTGTDNPACVGICATSTTVAPPPTLRVIKQASPRDVKIGDLVRYTVTVENTGTVDAIDATLVDTPPAGFTFVDGSLSVADRDGVGRLVGTYPIQVDQVDIAAGERATFTYLLRVGAGVRAGIHSNSALMRDNGKIVSNVATAEVQLIADPLLDHALILGTVFDDRDGDGWQDSAAIDDARVQGGFAADAYVPNSTTVDRGTGPKAEPDASSPMLHGIVLGSISARQSDADPVDAHRVVISQRLKELSFTDDFALTTKQGVTVRMDAAGTTRIERSGDAAKNLSGAAPTVERRVSPTEGGYVVDYIVRNTGVDERGIPGVRIASIEGLLMETDQYGRYHLEGVDVGTLERGRNFILKVDPSTLPPGSVFTTDNPLTRRVTPGLPVRFDWGVKLPAGLIEGGEEQIEMELGEVFFAPGSAEVRAQYLPAIEKMAAQIKQHRGGEVVISANGDSESLAFDRASAVKAELVKQLPADVLQALKVSVRGNADDPGSLIVGLGEGGALLGTVLFDTNKETIRPEFEPLLDKVAAALERMHGGVIAIVGHTDVRASYQYNTALGMRRAKAVYDALAQRLSPEVRAKVRVESSNDPTAPVDVKRN